MNLGLNLALGGGGSRGPRIVLSASRISEDALSGSTVGVLSVVGGDGVYTFAEVADPDNKFAVSGSNLNTNAALDYATAASHSVTVSADNGVDPVITQTLTITVLSEAVPVLSDPIDYYSGTSAANLTISTTANNGTLYWFITTDRQQNPNAATIKAGTGAVAFGSQPVTAAGRQTVPVSGLNPATGYFTYWVHTNNSLDSNTVRARGFVTDGTGGQPRIVAEGDSITFWDGSYAQRWQAANPGVPVAIQGFTSAGIGLPSQASGFNSLWGRRNQTIANNPEILTVFIGANDLAVFSSFDGTGTLANDWLLKLYEYLDFMRANCPNLQKILVATILPGKSPNWADAATINTRRAVVNPILRAAVGTKFEALIPFGEAIVDNPSGNDIISSDGVHPAIEGRKLMARIYTAVMDPLIANATGSNPAAFTLLDQNNVALNGTSIAETLVTGMGLGANATASQTGGRIARGAAAFGTGSITVCNGDFVRVEATGAATNDTTTDVALTIGTRADTFTARTIPANVVEFEHSTDGRTNQDSFSGGQSIFTNVSFPAGRPTVMVVEDGNNETAVTINGISAQRVGGSPDTTTRHSLWIGPPSQVLSAGNYEVRVNSSNTNAWCAIGPGAIRNCVQEVSAMTVRKLPLTAFTDLTVRTSPTTNVSSGALALFSYRGLPASFNSFADGENVFSYPAISSDSNRTLRWGAGRISGDLGINILSSTGSHALIVVELQYGEDGNPDPFTFTDQSGVPLSTVIESNTITVSGLAVPAAISVVGGEYAIDTGSGFGAWTSSPGTVNDGDAVKVRHTSAATNVTTTDTTLTIGDLSDTFTTTTEAAGGGTDRIIMAGGGYALMNGKTIAVFGTAYKED